MSYFLWFFYCFNCDLWQLIHNRIGYRHWIWADRKYNKTICRSNTSVAAEFLEKNFVKNTPSYIFITSVHHNWGFLQLLYNVVDWCLWIQVNDEHLRTTLPDDWKFEIRALVTKNIQHVFCHFSWLVLTSCSWFAAFKAMGWFLRKMFHIYLVDHQQYPWCRDKLLLLYFRVVIDSTGIWLNRLRNGDPDDVK